MLTLRIYVVFALVAVSATVLGTSTKSTQQPNSVRTCGKLNATWNGVGKFSSWLTGVCAYEGVWTSEALHNQHEFLLRVDVKKKSGSIFCPRRGRTKFPGLCEHGTIVIYTGRGDLKGRIENSGGVAQGRVMLLPGIYGSLQVEFRRTS